jgi:hypothetical protein
MRLEGGHDMMDMGGGKPMSMPMKPGHEHSGHGHH